MATACDVAGQTAGRQVASPPRSRCRAVVAQRFQWGLITTGNLHRMQGRLSGKPLASVTESPWRASWLVSTMYLGRKWMQTVVATAAALVGVAKHPNLFLPHRNNKGYPPALRTTAGGPGANPMTPSRPGASMLRHSACEAGVSTLAPTRLVPSQ